MLTPWEHQVEFINDLRTALKRNNAVIARAETGFGKTIVATWIALQQEDFIMTVHRKNLLRQSKKTFKKHGANPDKVIMVSQLKKIDPPTVLFVDEAHHSMAKTWREEILRMKKAGTLVIGASATPELLSGEGLGGVYDEIIEAKDMKWLIKEGYLSNYKYYAPHIPNMKGVKKVAGDYSKKEVSAIMSGKVIHDAVGFYKDICGNKRTIAFCASTQASKDFVSDAIECGVPAVHIDSTMKDEEIANAIDSFAKNGGILSNYGITGEGFDLEAQLDNVVPGSLTVEAVIMLRPTQSFGLYRQMVGRALRRKDYDAIILDMAGNVERHGLPDDDHEWSLQGKEKKDKEDVAVQRCPNCFNIQSPKKVCDDCGYIFEGQDKFIEEILGEMVLIDTEEWRRKKEEEIREAKTLKELVAIEKKRSFKFGWAEVQYKLKYDVNLKADKEGLKQIAEARGYPRSWVEIQCSVRSGRRW